MKRSIAGQLPRGRRGISLTEVILVLLGLLVLAAVLLPSGVRQAGESARRVQCLSNLKNLGLAATNFASGRNGQLLLLAEHGPGRATDAKVTWVLSMLPYLDRADAHENINQKTDAAQAKAAVSDVLKSSYAVLQCPNDVNHFKQPGGLSYGANIGYGAWHGTPATITTAYDFGARDHHAAAFDWNNNGKLDADDKAVARATGVFWFADNDKFRMSLDDIIQGDGASSTLLFVETVNLPPMHLTGPAKNGLNPQSWEAGVGLGIEALGLSKHKSPSLFVDRGQKASDQYRNYFKPDNSFVAVQGAWPWASSGHRGVINVVFADGHTTSISTDIDWAVWASLHSPDGVRHGQAAISESDN